MAQKMPTASRMSPMLTTSRMRGIGMGTHVAEDAALLTNSATVPDASRKWNGSLTSAVGEKPAASKAVGPDGHLPGVEDDGQRVEADPDRRHLEPRHLVVGGQSQTKSSP